MPFNPFKLLNHLKNTISKIPASKMIHTDPKVWNKSSHPFNVQDLVQLGQEALSSVQHSVKKIVKSADSTTDDLKNKLRRERKKISEAKLLQDISEAIKILNNLKDSSRPEENFGGIKSLVKLFREHPEVRRRAAQHGALRILLKRGLKDSNTLVKGVIREALTILGYIEPVSKRGIRILSIDGGGIKGLVVLEMLKKLEELTGKKTYELFDFVCGVSTGSLLAYLIGIHFRTLDEIIGIYEQLNQDLYNSHSTIAATGNLVLYHGYYNTEKWEDLLKQYLGTDTLISTSRNSQCPKICVVAAVVNQAQISTYLFRNYALPLELRSHYAGTFEAEVWQAARASAAAPIYFQEFKINDLILQDGGLCCNNPTAVAIHEARLLWPNTPFQCVLSCGTGRIVPNQSKGLDENKEKEMPNIGPFWKNQFYKIVDSATDTEAVHIVLHDLLPENIYYRFNPHLEEDVGIIGVEKKKQDQLKIDVLMYLRKSEDKFQQAAKILMLNKTMRQKFMDEVQLQRNLVGM